MTSTAKNSLTLPEISSMELKSQTPFSEEEIAASRAEIAQGMERLRKMPMCQANPELLEPYPPRSQEQRELVRKQLVERYSSNPFFQKQAKESGDEAKYWSNFTAGGIVHPRKEHP